jgi:hypothetical protein
MENPLRFEGPLIGREPTGSFAAAKTHNPPLKTAFRAPNSRRSFMSISTAVFGSEKLSSERLEVVEAV